MLIRCPHCNHRIIVRNASPRSYELDCPSCDESFFVLIERESGPDQRVTVFKTIQQMTRQLLEAKASRPVSKYRVTKPQARPENPESNLLDSEESRSDAQDDFSEPMIQDRPDVPQSLVGMLDNALSDHWDSTEIDLQDASRVMPNTHPVAYSSEGDDSQQDLLAQLQEELDAQLMSEQSSADEEAQETTVSRPETPRVDEEETHIHRQRPEFASVDEMIPKFPYDMQHQHIHESEDSDSSLFTNVDDVQAAEPTDLLNLEEDDNETSSDEVKEVLDAKELLAEKQTKNTKWFFWLKKR